VGIYIIAGRFFLDAKLRANTYYAVTTNRIIIVSEFPRRTVQSLIPRTLSDVSLTELSDGSGSVYFGKPSPFAVMSDGMPMPGSERQIGPRFCYIPDAKRVYEIIRDVQSKG